MSNATTSRLKLFSHLYYQHYFDDMEQLIEHFACFGGLYINSQESDLETLLTTSILPNYEHIATHIINSCEEDSLRLLQKIARGDRRMFSAFNRSNVSNERGGALLEQLQKRHLITIEHSREPKPIHNKRNPLPKVIAKHRISHKVQFYYPIMRFFFYFLYPFRRSISGGDFSECLHYFKTHKHRFVAYEFERLSLAMIQTLSSATIHSINSYWNRDLEIDLLCNNSNNEIIIGECKWANSTVTKRELTKLQEKERTLHLNATYYYLFSKRGFSKELNSIANKERNIHLVTAEAFCALISKDTHVEHFLTL